MAWQYFPYKTDKGTPGALPRDFVGGTVCGGTLSLREGVAESLREGVADFAPKPPTRLLLLLVLPARISPEGSEVTPHALSVRSWLVESRA